MSRDFETLYYEQQASFTESNGMLTQENAHLRAEVEKLRGALSDATNSIADLIIVDDREMAAPKGLPKDPKARKQVPLFSALFGYFPNALIAVARTCFVGNDQHHLGTPLHWDRSKSKDHEDCLLRHLMDHRLGVPVDTDGLDHLAKVAWRALALLETKLDPRAEPER